MRFTSFICITLLLVACGGKKDKPDVSEIKIDVKIERFDRDFFSMDTTHLMSSLEQLNQKYPGFLPEYFEYFLNPKNHKPGVPLEGISYHFYGRPSTTDHINDSYQFSFFDQANGFLDRVRFIESIRKRLAPHVFTQINELGNILKDHDYTDPIEDRYWNLSGAMYAYLFIELNKMGIDVVGESQLVGYPTQFPDVSMMNWKNGKPNARYWVLRLIKTNFGPGDKLVTTSVANQNIMGQAFVTTKGKKLLLVNRSEKEQSLELPDATGAAVNYVDLTTGDNPIGQTQLNNSTITLKPFAVTVVSWK